MNSAGKERSRLVVSVRAEARQALEAVVSEYGIVTDWTIISRSATPARTKGGRCKQ